MATGIYEGFYASLYSPPARSACVVDLSLQETGEPGNPDSKHIVGLKPQLLVAALRTSTSHGPPTILSALSQLELLSALLTPGTRHPPQ